MPMLVLMVSLELKSDVAPDSDLDLRNTVVSLTMPLATCVADTSADGIT